MSTVERHESGWLGHEQSAELSQVPTSVEMAPQIHKVIPAEVSMRILKEKFHFEGITRQRQARIVKFAICEHAPARSTQNLRLNIPLRGKTQRNRKQKAAKMLNRNCSLCFGIPIAYQLPCSLPV